MQQDNKQKTINGVALFFLICLVIRVLMMFCNSILDGKNIIVPEELQLTMSELIILVPTLIFALKKKSSFREDLGFKKIKAGTIFMSVLLAALISPAATLINLISQLFVPNTLAQASEELLSGSIPIVVFIASVYGPFCEEFCFRSAIMKYYEKGAGFIKAMLISSLFFGFMHLNVNQACYAFYLGIAFAIVNKASGSVYTSMIIHTCVNGANMLIVVASYKAIKAMGYKTDVFAMAEKMRTSTSILYFYIGVFLVLSVICIAIAVPCVIWIAKNEGQLEKLKDAFSRSKNKEVGKVRAFFNVPSVVATVLVLFLLFGLKPLLTLLGLS